MRRSLRVRLLVIVFVGIVLLTLLSVFMSMWQLFRVRNSAIVDSSGALHQQADSYLHSLAQVRAESTGQTLGAVRQIAETAKDYLTQTLLGDHSDTPLSLQTTQDGWRYVHGATTILLPSSGDEQALLDDLRFSEGLDLLLPGQARRVPEIVRISYMTELGALRTFPKLEPAALPLGWTVQSDPIYQMSIPRSNLLRTTTWSGTHLALDGSEQVLSVVTPVYQDDTFKGAVIVDVSLTRLTGYLERFRIEKTGFAFLLDHAGHLVAAPETGQQLLIGRAISSAEQGKVLLDPSIPGFESALLDMRRGRDGITTITLGGRQYLLAYAPISTISWNQALAVPLDEITAATAQTTERITQIAGEAQLSGLLVSLIAVGLISVVMSAVLRRQFVQPLATLINATKAVAAGDLQPIVANAENEIGQLAASFNTMTQSLQASRDELLATNQHLEQTVRDRTHDLRQALQLAEDANRMKTQFVANMSHELRTPLNAIMNFTHFMSKERYGPLTERQTELQQRVLVNADHLLGLINDILDLAKIEAGRMDLVQEPANLMPLLQGVMSTAVGLTKDKGLSLELDVPDDLPHVWIDKTRIRQVLLNLLSNAAKFTQQGGITLRAYTDQRPTTNDQRSAATNNGDAGLKGDDESLVVGRWSFVVIEVQDTGIGIAPEYQELVFEEFRQVQEEATREHQGTGLGLPISKRLVELHGGRMWLESAVGVGSTFSFTLPTVQQPTNGEVPGLSELDQAYERSEASSTNEHPLVSVVDDDSTALCTS